MIDSDVASKRHKHIVNVKGKRIIWLDEIKANCKCDVQLLKIIADGDEIPNEITMR